MLNTQRIAKYSQCRDVGSSRERKMPYNWAQENCVYGTQMFITLLTIAIYFRPIFSEPYSPRPLWIKPTDALNSNFIGITTRHVSGNLSAHHQEFLPTPGSKESQLHKVCQSRCTAKNIWWWAERLPETCRVAMPIKLEFSTSVGFIHKESVTMHGDTIVKIPKTNCHFFNLMPMERYSDIDIPIKNYSFWFNQSYTPCLFHYIF